MLMGIRFSTRRRRLRQAEAGRRAAEESGHEDPADQPKDCSFEFTLRCGAFFILPAAVRGKGRAARKNNASSALEIKEFFGLRCRHPRGKESCGWPAPGTSTGKTPAPRSPDRKGTARRGRPAKGAPRHAVR